MWQISKSNLTVAQEHPKITLHDSVTLLYDDICTLYTDANNAF